METPDSPASRAAQPSAVLAAPVINVSSPVSGVPGTTVTLTGSGFTGATSVNFGATPATSFTVVSPTRITAVAPPGSGAVQITVTTSEGTSNGIGFLYTTVAPVITSVVPNQGPVAGGNTVTLTGTGFTSATAVRFGATPAPFLIVSGTQITVIAPAGGAGTVPVTVTTPGGTSAGVSYTYVGAPSVTTVVPSQGPLSGGNTVTLTGTGFTGVTAVRFGATPATSFTVVTPTQITAVVPNGGPGPVQVTVTATGGTSTDGVSYFYVGAPVLTGVAPPAGPLAGGNTVTLTGSNLLGTTAVRFGVTLATSFTVVSATEISAVVPVGVAGTVGVSVTTPGGTSNAVSYQYAAAPILTTVVPDEGPLAGGNTVTLTGSNFTGTTGVLFGAVPAAFIVVSNTQLTATAPPGAAGAVNVTVVAPGGTSTGVPYTRLAPPGI
ncbi:IPT/TIG domain-containing protein [Streptomyces sp. NPDC006923]|uniref:IPT/TIG domain-containing protein n=1 Tax=Streptomyces sp. NPDC006923 TaxID=3155355 RepID=UPI00340A3A4A